MPGKRPLRLVEPGWNTCGQAAVACVVTRLANATIANAASITRDFPPDVPFGLGTSTPRMIAALQAHGLVAAWIHGSWFGSAAAQARSCLEAHLATGHPAIVCLDAGRMGGTPFSAHWAVATGITGDTVVLENVSQHEPVPLREFMTWWQCPHLPWRYNQCALLVRLRQARASDAATGPTA